MRHIIRKTPGISRRKRHILQLFPDIADPHALRLISRNKEDSLLFR